MAISTLGWIVFGVAAWLVVATFVGVLVGRMIARRDQQMPGESFALPVRYTDEDGLSRRLPVRAAGRDLPLI